MPVARISRVTVQRRLVAHQPEMAERVEEPALPMRSPRHRMISHRIVVVRTRRCSTVGECVWIVHEHLHPHRRGTKHTRAFPAVAFRLGEKERSPLDLQSDD